MYKNKEKCTPARPKDSYKNNLMELDEISY
jgi:hypothetical protein